MAGATTIPIEHPSPRAPEALLSICIPSFNRAAIVENLVASLLEQEGAFEIRVHVDGATDDTMERLARLADHRLFVSTACNQGRAGALNAAIRAARGQFIMIFDDDDLLWPCGLSQVLADCARGVPDSVAGFIYHLADASGSRVGTAFRGDRSNFLALRADWGVTGDKKEVVLAELLKKAVAGGSSHYRRIPTSLFWSRIALRHDIICRNVIIGRKYYMEGGMTAGIRRLKSANAWPMVLLYATHLRGFVMGRYRSPSYALRAAASLLVHSWSTLLHRIKELWPAYD